MNSRWVGLFILLLLLHGCDSADVSSADDARRGSLQLVIEEDEELHLSLASFYKYPAEWSSRITYTGKNHRIIMAFWDDGREPEFILTLPDGEHYVGNVASGSGVGFVATNDPDGFDTERDDFNITDCSIYGIDPCSGTSQGR